MSETVCHTCGEPVPPDAPQVGGHTYCTVHRQHLNRNRKSFWATSAIAIIGVVIFTLLVELVVSIAGITLSGTPLLIASVLLALVPALLWLAAFYLLDRDEPEPKGYVLGLALMAGAAALVIAIPVVRNLFQVQNWLGQSPWYIQLLGSVFIIGFTQEFCKYAVVRYTIFFDAEFDERVDGIIYGAAAGVGFGTVLTLQNLLGMGGAQLGLASIHAAIAILAQASIGGITGYFLGRAKFDNMGKLWLPAGICLAALLNGLVTWLLGEVSRSGLALKPINGLILAAVLAVLTFALLAMESIHLGQHSELEHTLSTTPPVA
ncbi:MAG: PrsW family intramembrane metalloprotease [Anaerolineae bacterium]